MAATLTSLQLHPTRRCNLACLHCYSESGPHVDEQLDIATLLACVRDAAHLGYRQLVISGGEPLLYPGLVELLAGARAAGMLTSLTSNGMLLTPDRWSPCAPWLDFAAISIDGRPDEHDAIRGRQGAFARTVANLPVVRASGIPFGLIFTLTQFNVDSLQFVVELAVEHGASNVQVHPLTSMGRALNEMPASAPDALELWAALAEAERLGKQAGIDVAVDMLNREQMLNYRMQLVPSPPVVCMTASAPTLIVQADGKVLPVTHDISPHLWLGSLHDAPLSELAHDWLAAGHGDELALACDQAWKTCCANLGDAGSAVNWLEHVAAATRTPE